MLHKRYQYNIKELKKILQNNKLTIAKADKSKTIVNINENTLEKKGTSPSLRSIRRTSSQLLSLQHIPKQHDILPQHLV